MSVSVMASRSLRRAVGAASNEQQASAVVSLLS